ncbi:MAG: hypothetical protein ACYS22_05120 [Planctomycetota bacterium]
MKNAAGAVIGIGSIMFMTGALNPAIADSLGNPASIRNVAESMGVGWSLAAGLMNAGTIITTIGTFLLALTLRQSGMIGFIAAACAAAASFSWISLGSPLITGSTTPSDSGIPPSIELYALLISSTVVLIGWAIARDGPRWLALTLIGTGTLTFAATLIGPLPVLVAQVPLLLLGGTLELGHATKASPSRMDPEL